MFHHTAACFSRFENPSIHSIFCDCLSLGLTVSGSISVSKCYLNFLLEITVPWDQKGIHSGTNSRIFGEEKCKQIGEIFSYRCWCRGSMISGHSALQVPGLFSLRRKAVATVLDLFKSGIEGKGEAWAASFPLGRKTEALPEKKPNRLLPVLDWLDPCCTANPCWKGGREKDGGNSSTLSSPLSSAQKAILVV